MQIITVYEAVPDTNAGTISIILLNLGEGNAINGQADNILKLEFTPKSRGTGMISAAAMLANSTGTKFSTAGASISIEILGKDALVSAINTAQGIYDSAVEGILPGQYPAGTKDRLSTAISNASSILNDTNATGDMLSQAVTDLNMAVAKFQGLVITTSTGDFNNDEVIDLGDIGIVAEFYGKTSVSEGSGWDAIKHMDINDDGEIGLYEVAFVVRRYLPR